MEVKKEKVWKHEYPTEKDVNKLFLSRSIPRRGRKGAGFDAQGIRRRKRLKYSYSVWKVIALKDYPINGETVPFVLVSMSDYLVIPLRKKDLDRYFDLKIREFCDISEYE
jgi:hypothetical protein